MTIALYTQLQQQNNQCLSENDRSFPSIGIEMPNIVESHLTIETVQCQRQELFRKIIDFAPQQGWVCYRDGVEIRSEAPTRSDVIEAEYLHRGDSLVVRHLNGETYLLSYLREGHQDGTGVMCYREQKMRLRNDITSSANHVVYRVWFQQSQSGLTQGRWLPKVQQFVGFVD
ncbi:hypothetical protein [Vibrio vulnificus YJ016]|uniref:Uncharacterized protein n=1 Tax=Vibrio vulnificus (strain YJ016) TaxID=196600 RepID=Q7MC50_VIBVY|nr:hypothetical protein [Vibrio vulnificus]PWY33425.1 hypothetical protein VV86_14800 [Vibrio vulnificus]BAC97563.1 hypothetical protein [Vibrio vulnificus YJ016]